MLPMGVLSGLLLRETDKKYEKKKKMEKLQNFWSDSLFFLKIGNVKLWPFVDNSALRITQTLYHNDLQ